MIYITTVLKDGTIRLPSMLMVEKKLKFGDVIEFELKNLKKSDIGGRKNARH